MNSENIKNLNFLLESEYIAIDSFESLINHANDINIKTKLQNIQRTHKQHTLQISTKIQDLGGRPSGSIGIQGVVAETISNIKHLGTTDNISYLKEALQGEFMAIKTINELITNNSAFSNSTILNNIIKDHQNNIDSLNNIINTSK
ncbi:DUF2383 domain-containing protein [Clostridium estertheticum]|uniref:DUF2383 domain-containing protein n=2 Tax=Clostridium estertheticum TaxID=238834 RepID=A0A1J0GCD1_9CLOT|nr:DUF2383 domain-containing protein [Clostridium estertheticum]APC38983.1 hypothetical protein A7L45_02335 [Clostridium estertheticum subsp. estertheticum]MBU3076153.1 PA2169 family four-helix-bundle protein [Clostridium estertheticum]MBU3166262.1 PA2169 family four-helix-bundle protein [Clostridium estertheticum]MBU3174342.1 PA2169 family four-helix-bundle protein [Clostridium estertheticum]MBX4262577.1 PA2169 family four-helix-bundle protein [Clostridium estertheticum]